MSHLQGPRTPEHRTVVVPGEPGGGTARGGPRPHPTHTHRVAHTFHQAHTDTRMTRPQHTDTHRPCSSAARPCPPPSARTYLNLHVVPDFLQSVLLAILVVLNELDHNAAHILLHLQTGQQGSRSDFLKPVPHLWSHLLKRPLPTLTPEPGDTPAVQTLLVFHSSHFPGTSPSHHTRPGESGPSTPALQSVWHSAAT